MRSITTTPLGLAILAGLLSFSPRSLLAQDSNTATTSVSAAVAAPAPVIASAPPAPVAKLPYGVEDVLKLSRANVGEDVILNYVRGSGTIYNLGPQEIVYLRDQGVSEKVINAMLDQRKRAELAVQPAPAPAVIQQPADVTTTASPAPQNNAAAPVYTDSNATYAQAPLTPPASTVYTIPYAPTYYVPYGYSYPYYTAYPYYGGWYGAPTVSFGFRFGGGWHGGHGFVAHGFGGHGFGGHGGHR